MEIARSRSSSRLETHPWSRITAKKFSQRKLTRSLPWPLMIANMTEKAASRPVGWWRNECRVFVESRRTL